MDKKHFFEEVPDEIFEAAAAAVANILPDKWYAKYENAYRHFGAWMDQKNVRIIDETVLLAYFQEQKNVWAPSTMWARYSMLRSTLNLNKSINIAQYSLLLAFLSQNSRGYMPKKLEILIGEHIEQFSMHASDDDFLDIKVILLFGVFGACRSCEFSKTEMTDVTDFNDIFYITIKNTKNLVDRKFAIPPMYYAMVKKYVSLRPANATTSRFFINFQKGRCINQNIGINKISKMPQRIAEFFNLPDPQKYTGHAFRRSSATLLADAGANRMMLKRHGGWKSDAVAEVAHSNANKNATASLIQRSMTSTVTSGALNENKENEPPAKPIRQDPGEEASPVIKLANCSNCTITIAKKD